MTNRLRTFSVIAACLATAAAVSTSAFVRAQTAPLPTDAPTLTAPIAAGSTAPDFAVAKWGGGTLKLSDYRGKVVILDFWATWCGPCQRSMPHIERVSQAVKDKNVVVVGVCVFDKPDEYKKWVPDHLDKLHFAFGFDPATRNTMASIANEKFGVKGIPCTFIIDANGKVADSIVGYGGVTDTRLESALGKLGVVVPAAPEVASTTTSAGH